MANSKKITGYTGSSTTPAVPTAIAGVMVREIANNAFATTTVNTAVTRVDVDTYANDITGAPWGAENVLWLKEPQCTISFDANGGSGSMADATANIGIAYTLPESGFTAPSGKEFDKWAIGSISGPQVSAGT